MSRPRNRTWLPHPARTINTTGACPTGLPRFRTADLARASIPAGVPLSRDTVNCPLCNGVHLTAHTT